MYENFERAENMGCRIDRRNVGECIFCILAACNDARRS